MSIVFEDIPGRRFKDQENGLLRGYAVYGHRYIRESRRNAALRDCRAQLISGYISYRRRAHGAEFYIVVRRGAVKTGSLYYSISARDTAIWREAGYE